MATELARLRAENERLLDMVAALDRREGVGERFV
jgi:hypothetical protein